MPLAVLMPVKNLNARAMEAIWPHHREPPRGPQHSTHTPLRRNLGVCPLVYGPGLMGVPLEHQARSASFRTAVKDVLTRVRGCLKILIGSARWLIIGGMEPRNPYPTDLTDKEWAFIEPYVPKAKSRGRRASYSKREILNGIFYILRSGCAWRLLPHDLPPWQIVYHYFWRWRNDGTWQLIHDLLRGDIRVAAGKQRQPSAGILDSQSVKTTEKGGSTAMISRKTSMAANATSWSTRSGCSWR